MQEELLHHFGQAAVCQTLGEVWISIPYGCNTPQEKVPIKIPTDILKAIPALVPIPETAKVSGNYCRYELEWVQFSKAVALVTTTLWISSGNILDHMPSQVMTTLANQLTHIHFALPKGALPYSIANATFGGNCQVCLNTYFFGIRVEDVI